MLGLLDDPVQGRALAQVAAEHADDGDVAQRPLPEPPLWPLVQRRLSLIAPGAAANFAFVAGDPLTGIRAVTALTQVMRGRGWPPARSPNYFSTPSTDTMPQVPR